ncbi:MAG: hypothetical protein LLG44_11830, partial [Chloroflexi bacterium]|nr:hypothetical protein [Chloroflexota bacterium]
MESEIDIVIPALDQTPGQGRKHSRCGLLIVALCFLVCSGVYIAVTPLFEAPNELFAVRYAVHLASTGRMPEPAATDNWWSLSDAHQPPLYYTLGSLFVHQIQPSTLDALEVNPNLSLSPDETPGNKNVLIHPISPQAYAEVSLPLYLLRTLSLLFSLASLYFTARITRILAPQDNQLLLVTCIIVALNPLFLVISTAASSLSMLILELLFVLYNSLHIISKKITDWRWFVSLGVGAGLAALTSSGGLVAWVLLPLTTFLLSPKLNSLKMSRRFALLGISMAAALAVAGWWYIRNWILYGDPMLWSAMQAAAYSNRISTDSSPFSNLVTYWGVFGWGNIPADRLYYSIMSILGTLGILGLVLELARVYWEQRSLRSTSWRLWVTAGGWAVAVGLVSLTTKLVQPSVAVLLAISPLLATAIYVGLRSWSREKIKKATIWVVPVSVVLLSVLSPGKYITSAYNPPATVELKDVPQTINDLNIRFGQDFFLLGYEIPQEHVAAGDSVSVRLYWLALSQIKENYSITLQVYGRDQEQIGGVISYPNAGRLATSTLLPGDVVSDEYVIHLNAQAQAPTAAEIRVGVTSPLKGTGLDVYSASGVLLESFPAIARLAVTAPSSASLKPQATLGTNLGDKVQLVGYDLSSTELEPGGKWRITLYWRPLVPLTEDYTVFIHLLNEQGESIAQIDEQPIGNYYPTSMWEIQDTIQDTHTLTLPSDLPAGGYTLSVGMYLLSTGQRLPIIP